MKLLPRLFCVSAAVAGLCLLGCDRTPRSSRERGNVAQAQDQAQPQPLPPQPQPEYVIVQQAPPAVIVEQRSPPPSGEYVWVDGYWLWNGNQYVWHVGYWDRPPRAGFIWIAPTYERHEQGFRITLGQWREQPREQRRR